MNITSKQPLNEPYYSPSLTIGSFDFYRGTLDLSGPLNSKKTVAYRLNLAYENAGSFRDFVDSENIFVAPALSFQLGSNTKLTFNFEYQNYNLTFDRGFPPQPEIFQVPISRFLGEPDFDDATVNTTYASTPGFKLTYVDMVGGEPYKFRAENADRKTLQVFVNPYTGNVMGDRIWDDTWLGFTFRLHYQLLAGDTGTIIMGIVALLTLILSLFAIL